MPVFAPTLSDPAERRALPNGWQVRGQGMTLHKQIDIIRIFDAMAARPEDGYTIPLVET